MFKSIVKYSGNAKDGNRNKAFAAGIEYSERNVAVDGEIISNENVKNSGDA